MIDAHDAALYPFVSGAQEHVSTYDESDLTSQEVIERARDRIKSAVSEGTVGKPHASDKVEVLSYPLARIIVSLSDEYKLMSQYSRAEAKTARERLIKNPDKFNLDDPEQFLCDEFGISVEPISKEEIINQTNIQDEWEELSEDDREELVKLLSTRSEQTTNYENMYQGDIDTALRTAGKLTDLNLFKDGNNLLTPVNVFLKYSPNQRPASWKLSNRTLIHGKVLITRDEKLSMIEEAVRQRVGGELPLDGVRRFENELSDVVSDVIQTIPDYMVSYDIDEVDEDCFPPVIVKLIEDIREGKPLPHMQRFTVATFLINIGMENDEILEMIGIADAPDYAKDATLYQLNQIRTGGGDDEPYQPPTYETIESWGLEWNTNEAEKDAPHPLLYYREKLQEKEETEE